jgi:hypothetical protein
LQVQQTTLYLHPVTGKTSVPQFLYTLFNNGPAALLVTSFLSQIIVQKTTKRFARKQKVIIFATRFKKEGTKEG